MRNFLIDQWIYGTLLSDKHMCNQSPSVLAFLPLPISLTTTVPWAALPASQPLSAPIPEDNDPWTEIAETRNKGFICSPQLLSWLFQPKPSIQRHFLSVQGNAFSMSHTIYHVCCTNIRYTYAIKNTPACFSFIQLGTPNWTHELALLHKHALRFAKRL